MCKAHYMEESMPGLTKHIVVEGKEVAEVGPVQGEHPGKEDMLASKDENHAFLLCLLFCYVD